VDMSSGATRWRKKVAVGMGGDSWSLTGRAGVVLVATRSEALSKRPFQLSGNDEIVAVDGDSGEVLWQWQVPRGKRVLNWLGSFADAPPSVLFSDGSGRPYRIRLCDGTVLWEGPAFSGEPGEVPDFSTGGMVVGHNGLAYVTSNVKRDKFNTTGRLSAYNVTSGQLVWRQEQAMPANAAPTVGRLAGAGSPLSVVVALGQNPDLPHPFREAWGSWLDGSPIAWYSDLRSFDAATGEMKSWRFTPPPHLKPQAEGDEYPDHICLPDAWSNGAIDARGTYFVGHMSGNIFALRDINGDGVLSTDQDSGEVTQHYGGRCYQGSPGIAPDLLVAAPCDGMHVFLGNSAL